MWRKQNLSTFSIAEFARKRVEAITCSKLPRPQIAFHDPTQIDPADRAAAEEAATEQAQEELGQTYRLVEIGEAATIDGLMRELDVRERLDVNIDRCIKRLLQVRGVKSISQESSGAASQATSTAEESCVIAKYQAVVIAIAGLCPDRLHPVIERRLERLLFVRGLSLSLKSTSAGSSDAPPVAPPFGLPPPKRAA